MVTDRRKKAQLVICLAFFLGTITGGLAMRLFYGQKPQPTNSVLEIATELTVRIGLNETQRTKAIEVLTESHKQRSELYNQIQPQLTSVRDTTRAKIRAMLTTEQQTKYDQWIQELDAKRLQKLHEGSTK